MNSRAGQPNLFFAELSRRQGGDVGETYSLTFRIPYHTAFYYCTHLIIHLHRPTHYLIASSVLSPLRLVLVSLHIGLRAQWILCPFSASSFSLAANLCAPANHHRISRRLHHRSSSPERHLEVRAHVKPKSHSSHLTRAVSCSPITPSLHFNHQHTLSTLLR